MIPSKRKNPRNNFYTQVQSFKGIWQVHLLEGYIIRPLIMVQGGLYCLLESDKNFKMEKHSQAEEFSRFDVLVGQLAHKPENPLTKAKLNIQPVTGRLAGNPGYAAGRFLHLRDIFSGSCNMIPKQKGWV
jgi:hypothetical protein